MSDLDQVTDPVANHGEGPVWWPGWGGLRWVDLLAGDVLALAPDGLVQRKHVGTIAGAIRPWRDRGMIVARERDFALVADDGLAVGLGELWNDPNVRMNDGGCDPDGRFYCGSMAYDGGAGRGSLYRIDHRLDVTVVLDHVTVSNGLAWSPDGSVAYYIDTATHHVDVFDYDEDGLHGRRPLVTIPEVDGVPDGMAVDADGHLWVAMHGGGAVHRFRPNGTPDGRLELPARDVTACTFGGRDLDRLYITTSRLEDPESRTAGALFCADVGVRGIPAVAFGGDAPQT